jgi:hypothetical protein
MLKRTLKTMWNIGKILSEALFYCAVLIVLLDLYHYHYASTTAFIYNEF